MDSYATWILIAAIIWIAYQAEKSISAKQSSQQESIDLIKTELSDIRAAVAALASEVEDMTLTPAEKDQKYLKSLPDLVSDSFVSLQLGAEISLQFLTYTDEGTPLLYSVEYIHRELSYRTPNQKDAVAYGKARLYSEDEFREVRIFFSRPHRTATRRGLVLDGWVKQGAELTNGVLRPQLH